MNTRFKPLVFVMLCLFSGFAIWKFFSKPLPTADNLPELSSQPPPKSDSQTEFQVIEVGGTKISPGDFAWELELHTRVSISQHHDEQFGLPKSDDSAKPSKIDVQDGPELRERIVSSVIERKVLYRYIQDKVRGFDLSDPARYSKCLAEVQDVTQSNPEFFAAPQSRERLKTKVCEESIVRQYLEEQIFKSVTVADTEIASYYRTHEKSYRKPVRVLLRQVVVAKEDLANELRKSIKQSNFSDLAKKHSITPEAANGGLIGPFSKEQLPTLFDIVFSMNAGDISGVIKSEYGFHIIMPVQKLPPQTISLTEATPEIRAELIRTKQLDAFQRWLNTAMNAISVTSPSSGIMQ
jgi:parvulin-like peptidyl-prolyl isomerase